MLKKNPKGGKPMKLGAIDWHSTLAGFRYKLGYCECGEKILATPDELEEIVNAFSYLLDDQPLRKRAVAYLTRRFAKGD